MYYTSQLACAEVYPTLHQPGFNPPPPHILTTINGYLGRWWGGGCGLGWPGLAGLLARDGRCSPTGALTTTSTTKTTVYTKKKGGKNVVWSSHRIPSCFEYSTFTTTTLPLLLRPARAGGRACVVCLQRWGTAGPATSRRTQGSTARNPTACNTGEDNRGGWGREKEWGR